MWSSGGEVALDKHIPVHVTYITARVDENGKLQTFGDFYGLDSRTAAALTGKSIRFEQPGYGPDDIVASGDPEDGASMQPYSPQPGYGQQRAARARSSTRARTTSPTRSIVSSRPDGQASRRCLQLAARQLLPAWRARAPHRRGSRQRSTIPRNPQSRARRPAPAATPSATTSAPRTGSCGAVQRSGNVTRAARSMSCGLSPERAQSSSAPSVNVCGSVPIDEDLGRGFLGSRIESVVATARRSPAGRPRRSTAAAVHAGLRACRMPRAASRSNGSGARPKRLLDRRQTLDAARHSLQRRAAAR